MKLDPIKRILVGVDHSPASLAAFHEGRRLAEANKAELHVVNVLDQRILDDLQWDYPFENADLVAGYERRLKYLISDHGGVDGHDGLLVGHPFAELVRAAVKKNADLLILGSRGFSGIKAGRVGSVASKCIRKAPLPVMLVRKSHEQPFRKIVACIDFSETSKRAAHHALRLAHQEGAVLELIYVSAVRDFVMTSFGSLEPAAPIVSFDNLVAAFQTEMADFAEEISRSDADVEVAWKVLEGRTVTATLCEYLTETQADLAVLGTRGRSLIKGLIIGTTAEGIIHDAPCSVLAIKPQGFSYDIA